MHNVNLSLIIPVYKNQDSIPELLDILDGLNVSLGGALEVVFVIDGSPDQSYEILLASLPSRSFSSQLILLSRNFGAFAAVRAGLSSASGEYFAVMSADLQEPPEMVIDMVKILREGDTDIVTAVRHSRSDPLFSRWAAGIFWWFYRRYVIPNIPKGGIGAFACNRAFKDQLLQLNEQHSSLVAQIFWLGFRRKSTGYVRRARKHGRSAWTFRNKLNYLMDSIFSSTDLPIKLLIRFGGGTALCAGLLGVLLIVFKYLGLILVPGYTGIILAIILFGALNIFGLGIVGSYAWRAYENTKARPLQIMMRKHQFN